MSSRRIKELEKQIEELKSRWPAHSVPPTMLQQLDELEEELEGELRRQIAMEIDVWKAQLEEERREKDRFFAGHRQSPIPPEDRAEFRGLEYYPPDPDYRFEIEPHEHEEKERVRMAYTKGEELDFIRWGEFRFPVGGEECVLQAYKGDPREERLFIPFRDATSGLQTYGGGRYLDLHPARDLTADGKWILDFNRAYNPWCVYSEEYTCPFVPPENWLTVPIHAGEKDYPKK
jgi:uncharacterized protein (DUF1684 family)